MKPLPSISRREALAGLAAGLAVSTAPFRAANAFAPVIANDISIPGYRTLALPAGRLPQRWSAVLSRHAGQDRVARLKGDRDPWRRLVARFSGRPLDASLLADVNAAINRRIWVSDLLNHGVDDHWATPREFLAAGGDCEDFAIAKFLLLRDLGFNELNQKVMICFDKPRGIAHAVTTCKLYRKIYILDNLNLRLIEGWTCRQYIPVYATDETQWVVFSAVNQSAVAAG